MVTDSLFKEIYQSGKYSDPHSELAKRLGVTRQQAKSMVFNHMYSGSLKDSLIKQVFPNG